MAADGSTSADSVAATFAASIEGLGPTDLSIVHLAMTKVIEFEAQGRSAEGEEMLVELLRLMRDE